MPKRTRDYRTGLLEDLRDPKEAASYLRAAAEDSPEMVLIALRDVAEARQMSKVAGDAGVQRESLYRMLCDAGNPTYRSLSSVLAAVGLKLSFVPLNPVSEPLTTPSRRAGGVANCVSITSQREEANRADCVSAGLLLGAFGPLAGDVTEQISSATYLGSVLNQSSTNYLPKYVPFTQTQTGVEVRP
jgi:probable addiction module antidote protein